MAIESEAGIARIGSAGGWLDNENWPTPSWISNSNYSDRVADFEEFYAHQLRSRYLELEADFRTVVGNYAASDRATGETIFRYLQAVRPALEQKKPDLLAVASTLDLVERLMVWLIPLHLLDVRVTSARIRLEELRPNAWESYASQLDPARDPNQLRMPLDEAIAVCNRHVLNEGIASGLQIRRLKTFRRRAIAAWFILLMLTPLLVNTSVNDLWPLNKEFETGWMGLWLPAYSMATFGMVGGFISGLFQASSSRVTLTDYRESMLKLGVRPALGGIAALILFVLLSWGLVPAVKTDTAGGFLMVAFVSGFSERYLLRLIDADKTEGQGKGDTDTQRALPATKSLHVLPPAK